MSVDIIADLALATVLISTALLLIALLRPLWLQWFGARATMRLWLLVPIAVVIAILPDRPFPTPNDSERISLSIQLEGMAGKLRQPLENTHQTFTGRAHLTADWLVGIWILGSLLCLFVLTTRQHRFRLSLGTLSYSQCRQWVCQRPGAGPMVIGFFNPKIILPADFTDRFNRQQRHLMLRHEHAHLRRWDPLWNLLSLTFRVVFWFNPLVHCGAGLMRRDQELACDEHVLASRTRWRRAYASALLRLAHHAHDTPALAFGPHPLKERIMQIANIKPIRPLQRKIGLVLTFLAGTSFALTAWALTPANSQPYEHVSQETAADWFSFDVEVTVDGEIASGNLILSGDSVRLRQDNDEFRMLARDSLMLEHSDADSGWSAEIGISRHGVEHFMVDAIIQFEGETVATPRMLIRADAPASIEQADPDTGRTLYRLQLSPASIEQLGDSAG